MRIVSKTQITIMQLALLPCIFLFFFGCSQLEQMSTTSVTFTLNTARGAVADLGDSSIDILLKGDGSYSSTVTKTVEPGKAITVTFEDVPVGENVYASAQLYTMLNNQKLLQYSGKSETKTVEEGDNQLSVKLSLAYNSLVETDSSCIILRPLFKVEHDNRKLTTNQLSFNREAQDETFCWEFDKLGSYQKALVTIKNTADREVRFKFVKTNTGAKYYQIMNPDFMHEVEGKSDTYVYEFTSLPQYIGINAFGIENDWNDNLGDWEEDFSCVIEKIELIKDSDLVDPDFNVVEKTDSQYIVRNPALQKTVTYMEINRNIVEFTPGEAQAIDGNPYNAAYWEFEDLNQYNRITVIFNGSAGKNLIFNGYLPADYSKGRTEDKHSADVADYKSEMSGSTQEKQLSKSLLLSGLNDSELKAIEFKNDDYTNGEAQWTLEIERIILEK